MCCQWNGSSAMHDFELPGPINFRVKFDQSEVTLACPIMRKYNLKVFISESASY